MHTVRKVKVPAKDQSRRSKDTESRADADKAVDDAADAVQDGVDQAEDFAQEGLDQLAEGRHESSPSGTLEGGCNMRTNGVACPLRKCNFSNVSHSRGGITA